VFIPHASPQAPVKLPTGRRSSPIPDPCERSHAGLAQLPPSCVHREASKRYGGRLGQGPLQMHQPEPVEAAWAMRAYERECRQRGLEACGVESLVGGRMRRTWPRACGAKAIFAERLCTETMHTHAPQASLGCALAHAPLAHFMSRRPLPRARLAGAAGARRARPAPSRRQQRTAPTTTAQVGFDIVGAVDADVFRTVFFATVGLTVVGFAGTFFILPQYADQVKESEPWKQIYLSLQASGLRSRTPKQVQAAQQEQG
jgi:hypothetical protein